MTGATGFVGRNLLSRLNDWNVVPALRRATEPENANAIELSLTSSKREWREALKGFDTVVHLAAIAHRDPKFQRNNRDLFHLINTQATIMIAEASRDAGVRHFVHFSTIGVHGSSTDNREPFRETDAFDPQTVYAHSKVAAEEGLQRFSEDAAFVVTIVRPPLIHGPGAPGSFALLRKAIMRGIPLPFASILNRRAFLGIDNLASFLAYRLADREARSDAFIVSDREQVSTSDFVLRIGQALGRQPSMFAFPPAALEKTLRVIGRSNMADGLIRSLEVDSIRMRASGWVTPYTLSEGLQLAVRSGPP